MNLIFQLVANPGGPLHLDQLVSLITALPCFLGINVLFLIYCKTSSYCCPGVLQPPYDLMLDNKVRDASPEITSPERSRDTAVLIAFPKPNSARCPVSDDIKSHHKVQKN